jgi:murein DD-endopeptidase MepM/ murein hydrolase activator NlpD
MAVLQAAVNPDPHPEKIEDIVPNVSGNALIAEIGPAGTPVDVIDGESTQISIYTVRKGDTLSEIALMFDVSVNTIIWANDLGRAGSIREGQNLVILPISGVRHTIAKGDTIKGIVAKYKVDLEEVLIYNDLTLSSVLIPGRVLIIPDAEISGQVPSSSSNIAASKSPSYPGYYIRPIQGGHKSQGIHGHNGVDLAAPVGTPIYASAAGTVIVSIKGGGWNGGYGNYIVISHSNGTQTLYSHNQENLVIVGETVEQGQMIARIGLTGKTTGPHVHFEIRGARNPF